MDETFLALAVVGLLVLVALAVSAAIDVWNHYRD